MSYSIEIMPQALNEIETAYRWIANNLGTEYVERWDEELNEGLESLSKFPNRCPIVPRPKPTTTLIRQLKVKNYRILFSVGTTMVSILSVRHVRQRLFPK